jgi:hypothetical protein
VDRDGYYIMSIICVSLGAILLMGFILPTVKRLQCEFIACRMGTRLMISSTDECLEGEDTKLDPRATLLKKMHTHQSPHLILPHDANTRRLILSGSVNTTAYRMPQLFFTLFPFCHITYEGWS